MTSEIAAELSSMEVPFLDKSDAVQSSLRGEVAGNESGLQRTCPLGLLIIMLIMLHFSFLFIRYDIYHSIFIFFIHYYYPSLESSQFGQYIYSYIYIYIYILI